MENYQKQTRAIARNAAIGLYTAAASIILAVIFYYASIWRFTPTAYTSRWMLIAGSVLAVLAVSMGLLVVRRQVPALRQADSLEAKLNGYVSYVRSLYFSLAAVVFVLSALMVLANQNVLLMLAIVATLFLILNYPNIYRVKVDLGLTDDEVRQLYGDRYVS